LKENINSGSEILKSCVLPYRITNGELELLMITSIKKQKWIFPKGYIEFNLSAFESAKKEAYEEAGVVGENETVELGSFHLKKKNETALLKVFSMEVTKELKDYPEKSLRKRKWFTLADVNNQIENQELKNLIVKLKQNLKLTNQNPS
jgi:8-oxo-dGTP pyrophosphatase MutT (NUDIX family)